MVANMSRIRSRSSSSNSVTGRVRRCMTGVPQRVIGSTVPPVRSSSMVLVSRWHAGEGTAWRAWNACSGDSEWSTWLSDDLPPLFEVMLGGLLCAICEHGGAWLEHTVRAYRTDLIDLFRSSRSAQASISLRGRPAGLAKLAGQPADRAATHAAPCSGGRPLRGVLRLGPRTAGRTTTDPAANLRSRKTVRVLPPTLEPATAAQHARRRHRDSRKPADPVAARDVAILELLYCHRDPGLRAVRARSR